MGGFLGKDTCTSRKIMLPKRQSATGRKERIRNQEGVKESHHYKCITLTFGIFHNLTHL